MPRILELDEAKTSPDWRVVFDFGPRVNAGDAAAILEESPYETAYGLWLLKSKRKPPKPQTDAMRSGQATEPLIFEWYKSYVGFDGISQAWALDDESPWIQAKVDFWNAERKHLAEFKAPSRDDTADHRSALEGRIPYHYWLQCIHEMEVFDAATCDFVSWRGPEDNIVIPVTRDTEFWLTVMVPAYQEFWRRIQEDTWPQPEGTVEQVSQEWQEAARMYLDARYLKRDLEGREARATATLRRMATAKTTTGGGIKASWMAYKPRWEVKISAESEAAMQRILKAVEPLEGRAGVGKIGHTAWPPNLVLRVSEVKG